MLTRSPLSALRVLAAAATTAAVAACGGPEPRDASNAAPIPIHNTAAFVQGPLTVSDVPTSPQVEAVLAEPDRDARDRALDGRYQAADVLSFFALQPGARVAELAAGGCYFTARIPSPGSARFYVGPPHGPRYAFHGVVAGGPGVPGLA